MGKYDAHIRCYQDLLLENPNLSLKEYCLQHGINYDCLKTAVYRKGGHINQIRKKQKRTFRVSYHLNNDFANSLLNEFFNQKGVLFDIPVQDTKLFISAFEEQINKCKRIDESFFWGVYDAIQSKHSFFPSNLSLLIRFFLFQIHKQGILTLFSDDLLRNHFTNSYFQQFLQQGHYIPSRIFVYHYNIGKRTVTSYCYVPIHNDSLLAIYNNFIENNQKEAFLRDVKLVAPYFEKSFGPSIKVNTNPIIDEQSFWTQILFFKSNKDLSSIRSQAIRHIILFYIYYIDSLKQKGHVFHSKLITISLLRTASFQKYIEEGYSFYSLSQARSSDYLNKAIIILPDLSTITNRITNRDFIKLDLSGINHPLYRQIVSHYCVSSKKTLVYVSNLIGFISKSINYLHKIKVSNDAEFETISIDEARQLRSFVINSNQSTSMANSKLSVLKGLIRWSEKNNRIIVLNKLVYKYFTFIENQIDNPPTAIPLEHATAIAKALFEKGKNKLSYRHYFAVLVLLIETEFRPSEICSIKYNGFSVIKSKGTYQLKGITKTSKGDIETVPISKYSNDILEKTLIDTTEIRRKCLDNNQRDFLFIYPPDVKTEKQGIRVITQQRFSEVVSNICDELRLPHYTAQNFRDAHMTFAQRYDTDNHGNNFYLKILSGHKTVVTTKEHYVDKTYNVLSGTPSGFLIGTEKELEEIESRILLRIPKEFNDETHKTIDNIGVCSLQACHYSNMISCVLCPHIWYIANQDEKPLKALLHDIESNLSKNLSSHEREHQIHLKNAIQQRIIAITDFLSRQASKNE